MVDTRFSRGPSTDGAPAEELGEAEFLMAMNVLGSAAGIVADLPLEQLLAKIERAEAGRRWVQPGANLLDQRDLVEAFQVVAAAVDRIRERAS